MKITKMDGMSANITAETLAQLRQIMPEVFTEDRVDFEKLQAVLGEHIEKSNEKYEFNWRGKFDAMRLAQLQSTGTLLPAPGESKDWDTTENLYIEGDNLEVLKLLQKSYKNSVKMIYIDPPYNTMSDFVYEDDFSDNIANYKKITGQQNKSNTETSGRYHTNWLNMMMPRLKLARSLLRPDGVIFMSIDDNEVTNLRKLGDEIFGEDNFVAQAIRRTINSGKHDTKTVAAFHEYVLVYAKNIGNLALSKKQKTDEEKDGLYKETDSHVEERGRFYVSQLNKSSIQYSDSLNYPIKGPDGVDIYPGEGFHDKKWCWRWGKEKLQWGLENDYIVFKKQDGKYKVYAKSYEYRDNNGEPIERSNPYNTLEFVAKEYGNFNATPELSAVFDGKKYFDFPKSVVFVKELIKLANVQGDDVVLDFFSGSATTAHAVMQLNAEDGGSRRFVMVQLPELLEENTEAYNAGFRTICDIGKARIRRAGKKIKDENPMLTANLDVGFKVFKLDISNLKKWNSAPTDDVDEIQQRIKDNIFYLEDGRKDMDVVYEILLKYGLKLTTPVTTQKFGGTTVHIANDPQYRLAICLTPNTPLADIEKMVDGDFGVYIFVDRCFADANVLINTQELLDKREKKLILF